MGTTDSVLFSKPGYNALGDPYKPAAVGGKRIFEHKTFLKGGHDIDFKPAKTIHEKVARPAKYPYMPQGGDVNVKKYRDEEGNVITAPRNFTTTRMKRGKVGRGTTFGGVIPSMPDNLDEERKKLWKKEQ